MKGMKRILLLLALVALSHAWRHDSPEDTSKQVAEFDKLQDFRGFNGDSVEYPENVLSYSRSRRGRGGGIRSSIRKVLHQKTAKTQQRNDDEDETVSAVDEKLTYVTLRPLPAQDRNYPISRTLSEEVLQIMGNIVGEGYNFSIPMINIRCSSAFPALKRHKAYSSSQQTIGVDLIINTECFYYRSTSTNTAITKASITFSMSPEPHFIINKIEVEPKTDNDFRGSNGSLNNPLDTILGYSRNLIHFYLKESVAAVFSNLSMKG